MNIKYEYKKAPKSGIQKKYLKYILALLLLALFLSSLCVIVYVHGKLETAIIDKYSFMCEKMGFSLDGQFQKTDEATAACILDEDIQKSLMAGTMSSGVERNMLGKYFAYVDLENVSEYCYVDNKRHVYTRSYSRITFHTFRKSKLEDFLGEEYGSTKWFWTEDTLFETGKPTLFVGRYVRSMDYAHEPGMLFLKMDDSFLENLINDEKNDVQNVIIGITDSKGNICISRCPKGVGISEENRETLSVLAQTEGNGMFMDGVKVKGGVLSAYRQRESGFIVFVFVQDRVFYRGMGEILFVMTGIYFIIMILAVILSVHFSKRLSRPIQEISRVMEGFRGNDYSRMEELHTNTELDQIGYSYNEMLGNIEQLVKEVKEQEKEVHTMEMNILIEQINPHFLYNTLDTIYMLARINKEETTMRMISALSKYLRLCLSKGGSVVTVEDELENVKNYMEIQQIRNSNLFHYEIKCEIDPAREQIIKLILQPIVENAIKYGFSDIYEGGLIRIRVWKEEEYLVFEIYNNGIPMKEEMCNKINGLAHMPLPEMKSCFQAKKNGYGIVNIITRLRLKYVDDIVFSVIAEEGGTTFIIKVPGQKKEAEKG